MKRRRARHGARAEVLAASLLGALLPALLACDGMARVEPAHPNIILISVDTLRADHLSLYGYASPTSPRIDAWARRFAVVFRHAVAQAPWTLPSHCSLLTGLDALRHGVNYPFEAAPEELITLAERLSAAGYFTAGITGGGWLHPQYGLAGGYDRYLYWLDKRGGDQELEAHAPIASRWLSELRQPFFLFLHTYDVHDFNAPRRMDPLGSEDPGSHLVRHYDRAVEHMDDLIGDFLERFGASGLRGRTIVALTSDHGEDLGEDGVFGHGSLRDQVLLVPLALELPDGQSAGRVIEAQVRSVDVVPTLLDVAGIEVPPGLDGVSLRALTQGRFAAVPPLATSYFSLEHGLSLRWRNRWQYVYDSSVWKSADDREALFRLAGGDAREGDRAAVNRRSGEFRALARRLLDERLAGLSLRFENALPLPFAGTLRGDLIHAGVPKSTDLVGPWLTRVAEDAAGFSVPPGRHFQLLFERVGNARLELEATPLEGEAQRLAIDLEAVSLPAQYRWTGTVWQTGAGSAGSGTGVTLDWHGAAGLGSARPFEQDPELRRQLEALGYLE